MNHFEGRIGFLLMLTAWCLPLKAQWRGVVMDSIAQEPIGFATVVVLNVRDSVVAGSITSEEGKFEVKADVVQARLRVDAVGYKSQIFGPFSKTQSTKSLILNLKGAEVLPAVEITAQQDFLQNKIDRKVYNADRNLVTQGGSATDLLNTIPSVSVDPDGQLNLRGNPNVTVFIDGRPSSLTGSSRAAVLEQLPASAIKSIEVITQPSAKFDPDGTAGIINIITKKESRQGLNGSITTGIGTHDKYNFAATANLRKKHFNLNANYSGRIENRWNEGDVFIFTPADSLSPYQNQISNGERRSVDHVAKLGVDFFPNEKTVLGVAATYGNSQKNGSEEGVFWESNSIRTPIERYIRTTIESEPKQNWDGEVFIQHKPKRQGSSLDGRISLSQNKVTDIERYLTDSLDVSGLDLGLNGPIQTGVTPRKFTLGLAQIDFELPLKNNFRLETGAKSTIRDIQSEYLFGTYLDESAPFELDSSISNSFAYREQVHAVYTILGKNWGKLGVEGGLRAEQALTGFTLFNTDSSYTNNYFNLFPSAHVAYRKSDQFEWRLGYSRRINRPETDNLNPFTEYSNPKRLRRGNPNLQPEYIHSMELSQVWRHKMGSLSTTAYYRLLNNSFTRVIQNIGGDTVQISFENLLRGHTVGMELIAQVQPHKTIDVTLSANMFRSSVDASNVEADLQLINYGVDGRAMLSFSPAKRWSLQTTFNYQPPRVGPQGRISSRYNLDGALKWTLMKGKGNLSLRVSDIFDTLRFQVVADDEGLYSEFYNKRETRIGFLNFSYRFGQEDRGTKKPKREDREGGGGGFDF